MTFLNMGYLFVVAGVVLAVSGGGIPPFGFRAGFRLFNEYKSLRAKGCEPSLDQKGAFYTFISYGIAAVCISLGVILLISSKFSEG